MAVRAKPYAAPPMSPQRARPSAEAGVPAAYAIKRLLLGRPLATARLEHERLGKPTALAVFASDNLSSSAYATEEILRVLIPVGGVAAFSLVFPISLVIVGILAILLFSYRQTIKAYPSAGGAYVVTKDNFGLLAAQVAGVSLLIDYVLTVSVSVAAGVQALTSVVDALFPYRVVIAVGFIWLIAWGNLRGVRESGRIFAVPTYLFIVSMLAMLAVGLFRVFTGSLSPLPTQHLRNAIHVGTAALGVIVVLRAFASGGAAVTGVEAISNGVTAFQRPAWRNARTTLMWMGTLLGAMFLGLSYLVHRLHVVPVADESKSVLAQVGQAVYGNGPVGHALYLVLQAATMMILVLAANTSFADFPRLAHVHAADSFLPRTFTKRGHRLVFSSGIVALAAVSTLLVVAFNASVTALIPLYALGVFLSFTMSQAGMARHHLREREPGWRLGLVVNATGAVATAIVDVIIAVVKFHPAGTVGGSWIIVIAVPLLVFLLVRMNRQYRAEDGELEAGIATLAPPGAHVMVVLVDDTSAKTLHALQYALTARPDRLHLVHLPGGEDPGGRKLLGEWSRRVRDRALEVVACPGDRSACLHDYLARVRRPGETVTVVVAGPARRSFAERLRMGRTGARLAEDLLDLPDVNVTVVREHGGAGHGVSSAEGHAEVLARPRHEVLLLIDRVDASTLRAIRYARSLHPLEISAVHIADDPERADALLRRWASLQPQVEIPLQAVFCPDRNIGRCLQQVVSEREASDTEVTVVIPRRDYARVWHRLLHDRTSRAIARALADRPHVDLVVVPYHLGRAANDVPAVAARV